MAVDNHDYLENRLKEATTEDSGQILEEFLKAFYADRSEAGADKRPSAPSESELET
jgi:hypothetical protein